MADYAFYKDSYGGTLVDEAEFGRLALRAEDRAAGYERLYTVCYPAPDSRRRALCALADELALGERATAEAEGRVTRVAIGSASTSFAGLDPAWLAQGEEQRCYRAFIRHADVYRGAGLAHCAEDDGQ